ncbi:MAG: hypothetical protein JXR73_08525, partial [Candidatus Omnitrophica bacterium]|nr:hypothetical protein [Candidatus Omnitrophota bacterium]
MHFSIMDLYDILKSNRIYAALGRRKALYSFLRNGAVQWGREQCGLVFAISQTSRTNSIGVLFAGSVFFEDGSSI